MAGKKSGSKGAKGSNTAVAVVEAQALQKAQKQYQKSASPVSAAIHAINFELKDEKQFITKLLRARLLLDHSEKIKETLNVNEYYQLVQDVYNSIPAGSEAGPAGGSGRVSLSMVSARAGVLALLADKNPDLSTEALIDGMQYAHKYIQKGFSRNSWSKVWYDPKSEQLADVKLKDGKQLNTSVEIAAYLFSQLAGAYSRLYLTATVVRKASIQGLPTMQDIKSAEFQSEVTAALASTEKASKQLQQQAEAKLQQAEAKLQQQQVEAKLRQQQLSSVSDQQRSRAARDAERARDVKRGKPQPEDNKKQQLLEQARAEEQKDAEEAAKVLAFLEQQVLGDDLTVQEHISKLSNLVAVKPEQLKDVLKELSDKSKDKEHPVIQMYKQQLGDVNANDGRLQEQLTNLADEEVWQLYLDEAAAQSKAGRPLLFKEANEFEEHVVTTYLDKDIERLPKAFADAPSLATTYSSKGQLPEQLADAAADALMHGKDAAQDNPWLQAFSQECPLQRYVRTYDNARIEDFFVNEHSAVTDGEDESYKQRRITTAVGFALLMMERNQIAVDCAELSNKPDWIVLAYNTLRLIPALFFNAPHDHDVLVTYHFWRAREACLSEYQRISRPHECRDDSSYTVNGASTSAPEPRFTEGLAEDNATMLDMLFRDRLLAGPLLLAVQVFLQRLIGKTLEIGSLQDDQLNVSAVESVLSELPVERQLELRQFLFQVLYWCNANLGAYQRFVMEQQRHRVRPDEVPVEAQYVTKDGKQEVQLGLSQDYYEQACLLAAASRQPNLGCCAKHHSMQLQSEADGTQFSKYDRGVGYDDFLCNDPIPQPDASLAQRYLLEPSRVAQAQEEKQLKVGTKEGLKALVDKLFGINEHQRQDQAVSEAQQQLDPRTSWDKARMDLAHASQLAMHRYQLGKMVEQMEKDLDNMLLGTNELRNSMRALLAQRSAGSVWQLRVWLWFFDQQIDKLREEDRSIQEQLRQLADAADKEKAGKGSNKETNKEKEERLNQRQQQVLVQISNYESYISTVKTLQSRAMTEAQSYPDLIRSYYSAEAGLENPLVSMMSLITNELLAPAQPDVNGQRARLRETISLARLTLFDLDVWITCHVLTARRRVLASMWKYSQTVVVLKLSVEALKKNLLESISSSFVDELLREEETALKEKQAQQQQQSKTASKKKKKKGAAAKPAVKKLTIVSDDESEGEEQQTAAAATDELQDDEQQQDADAEEDDPDGGWGKNVVFDVSKLGLDLDDQLEHKQQQRVQQQRQHADRRDSSSTGRDIGGRTAAAEPHGAAAAGKRGKGADAAARPGSAATAATRPEAPAAAVAKDGRTRLAAAGSEWDWQADDYHPLHGPVCARCGSKGHIAPECTATPYCKQCRKPGHETGFCQSACFTCGKTGHRSDSCKARACRVPDCKLCGHKPEECPWNTCFNCYKRGHIAKECRIPVCTECKQPGHDRSKCPGWCEKCKEAGHRTSQCKRCPVCRQLGHTTGSPECPGSSSNTAGAAAASNSRAGRPGSSSRRSQHDVLPPPPPPPPPAAAPAAAARKEPLQPDKISLLSQDKAMEQNMFINRLASHDVVQSYAFGLFDTEKLGVLCRISQPDLGRILEQPEQAAAFFDAVYSHWKKASSGSKQPVQLTAQACDVFQHALPPRLRKLLPDNWQTFSSWTVLETMTRKRAGSEWGGEESKAFNEAKSRAAGADGAADAADAPAQQQAAEMQLQRSGREQQRSGSESGPANRSSSSGAGSRSATQQQQPVPPLPAAATAAAAPATVSFKQAADVQEQHSTSAAAAVDEAPHGPAAAGSGQHGLSQQPAYQQQQHGQQAMVPPSPLYAAPPQPSAAQAAPWLRPEQQQQHADVPASSGMMLPSGLSFEGKLQPWMLHHHEGAERAVRQLVPDAPTKVQLLDVVYTAGPGHVLQQLEGAVFCILKALGATDSQWLGRPATELLMPLAELVSHAKKAGPHPPAPVPSPMPQPVAGLLPHLQLQQRQGSYGTAAPQVQPPAAVPGLLPPYLQQQKQPQHWPVQQQQPGTPVADSGDESDDDALLGLLTGGDSGSGAAVQQPAVKTGWNVQPGQQHAPAQYDPNFPLLGDEDGTQHALAASLQDQQHSSSHSIATGGSRPPAPAVSAAGLANEAGEYNCFLNVVVQCLWSCGDFRNQVYELPGIVADHPVVSSLKKLFVQMQQAELGWQPGCDRAVVNPTTLRDALDEATHFRRQEMNDAMELLDTLYQCFRNAQPPSESSYQGSCGVLIDSVFGLRVNEQVRCRRADCGKCTHRIPSHWEHMLVVNTMGLQFAAEDAIASGRGSDMSVFLRCLFDQEMKMCDRDEGGCGTPYAPERQCEATPKVLTLQLVWDQDVSGQDIGNALKHIHEHVDINRLYVGGVSTADTAYQLSSAVAYYGQHYMAFVYNTNLQTWLLFDDASVSQVGSWQDVIKKCVNGKIQPSVLFYQGVDMQQLAAQPLPAPSRPVAAAVPAPLAAAAAGGSGGWQPLPTHMPHMQSALPPQQPPMAAAGGSAAGGAPWAHRPQPQYMQHPPQLAQSAAAGPEPDSMDASFEQPPVSSFAAWNNAQASQQDAWGAPSSVSAPATGAAGPAGPEPAAQKPAWGGAGLQRPRLAAQALAQATGRGGPTSAPGGGRGAGPQRTGPAGRGQGEVPYRGGGRGGRG